ncbi:zinc-ribbon and DUF3426 domain-containing protein [uncultured Zhongshania sp.]|uniref:zinc-ribbon and DUF3426 domain-containing protein n=1 Tax=uncultured Zhongshania sp. TaxID=1642288 RepID=UPI0030D8CF68|tara:strand:+ start:821 stop:1669 length:849 start_codon:yes stop_codon:yes gene_type:complete
MPAENITPKSIQCPKCETRFRVKAEQLLLADGLVRCSVCMSIFSGIDDNTSASILLTDLDDDTPSAEHEVDDAPAPKANTELSAEDDENDDSSLRGAPPELDLLSGLSTVNHDFEHHQARQNKIQWFWLLANTVALLVLVVQIALWQKAALFNSPIGDELRKLCPLHPTLCEDKPTQRSSAVTDVISTKLIVRKHPTTSNALMVDTILVNRGPASTSFPELQLRFSDINNQTVASRTFKPAEYLAGELSAGASLASQQPVHIALEIVDPGPQAVNYQLQLMP